MLRLDAHRNRFNGFSPCLSPLPRLHLRHVSPSYSCVWVHLVWATLERRPLLDKAAAAKLSIHFTRYAHEKALMRVGAASIYIYIYIYLSIYSFTQNQRESSNPKNFVVRPGQQRKRTTAERLGAGSFRIVRSGMPDCLFRKNAAPSVIWGERLAGKFAVAARAGNGPVFSSWPTSLAKRSLGYRDHWACFGRHLPSCSNGKFGARMGFPERLLSLGAGMVSRGLHGQGCGSAFSDSFEKLLPLWPLASRFGNDADRLFWLGLPG